MALARYAPAGTLDEMARLTEEATRIAQSWHRAGDLGRVLTYRGVNLGPGTERGLLSHITLGLTKQHGRS